MSIEEILIILTAFTALTTLIQLVEMAILIHNQRYTNYLLENVGHLAGDGMQQFITDLVSDKQKQAAWFGFVQMCGQHAIGAAKAEMMPKLPKIKSLGDVISALLQMPVIQTKIEEKATKILDGTAQKAAAETVKEFGA